MILVNIKKSLDHLNNTAGKLLNRDFFWYLIDQYPLLSLEIVCYGITSGYQKYIQKKIRKMAELLRTSLANQNLAAETNFDRPFRNKSDKKSDVIKE